jgi:parallel beta-helix repeat protein
MLHTKQRRSFQAPSISRKAFRPRLEPLEDRWVPSTFFVNNTNDSGSGSLRQAILDANSNSGQDTISFANLASGVQTIQVQSALPTITDSVIIDGSTKPDYTGAPLVVIDGELLTTPANGLEVSASNSTIKALVINHFKASGIVIDNGATANVVQGCYLGTDSSGGVAQGNSDGITVMTSNNTIGGMITNARNIISGNTSHGIVIIGSSGNLVQGNYIGTNSSGTAGVGNQLDGILIQGGSTSNTVGGTLSQARNIISANKEDGVRIAGLGTNTNLVQGNYIGTTVSGRAALGNSEDGVRIFNTASGNTVGGLTTGARNIISANSEHGILLSNSASGNQVEGNYIGTDVTGGVGLGNSGSGVRIDAGATSNTIGGTLAADRNLISANGRDGVAISGVGTNRNVVERNSIGVTARGTALGNLMYGVNITGQAQNNQIGEAPTGKILGLGNTMEFNTLAGVGVLGTGTTGNSIRGNSIFSNGRLGIDLNEDGVTLNHQGGAISGPNNYQNFPVITSATQVTGGTQVNGTLNSDANTTFTIDFYSSTSADASGYGQGQKDVGMTVVTTDANGNATFSVILKPAVPIGRALSATATDPGGNTSEFAQDVTVQASPHAASVTDPDATLTAALVGHSSATVTAAGASPTMKQPSSAGMANVVVSAKATDAGFVVAPHHQMGEATSDRLGVFDWVFASVFDTR